MAITSIELSKQQFDGFVLPSPHGEFLGVLEPTTSVFIWGSKGSGKSTFSLDLAKVMAEHFGDGHVIYFSPEEGISRTMQDKIRRVNAGRPNLLISDWFSLQHLKKEVQTNDAKAIFLDSAQMSRLTASEMEELHTWTKHQPVQLWIINHATKDGNYKGSSMYGHMVDIELKVEDGIVTNEKNRCGGEGEMPVNFGKRQSLEQHNTGRKNPSKSDDALLNELEETFPGLVEELRSDLDSGRLNLAPYYADVEKSRKDLAKDEFSTAEYKRALQILDQIGKNQSKGQSPKMRQNPVPVPFITTLQKLDNHHKIRHARRLNDLLNFDQGCFVPNRQYEKGQLSFRYNRRQRNGKKVSILELLIDGTIQDETCDVNFAKTWNAILKRNGDLEVVISDQEHAKVVLGAREYKKQEKLNEKGSSSKSSSKKKSSGRKILRKLHMNRDLGDPDIDLSKVLVFTYEQDGEDVYTYFDTMTKSEAKVLWEEAMRNLAEYTTEQVGHHTAIGVLGALQDEYRKYVNEFEKGLSGKTQKKAVRPKKISEFKRWLEENIGNKILYAFRPGIKTWDSSFVKRQKRIIKSVELDKFRIDKNIQDGNSNSTWVEFDHDMDWDFTPDYAEKRSDGNRHRFYYDSNTDHPSRKKGPDYQLPVVMRKYFKPGGEEIPLDKVIVRKKNPQSRIDNAHKHMAAAYNSEGEKRAPISVFKEGKNYVVIDGNATTMAAKNSLWPIIRATIEPKPETKQPQKKKAPVLKKKAPVKKKKTAKSGQYDAFDAGLDKLTQLLTS